MSKGKKNSSFDASRFATLEQVEEAIKTHKDGLHRKIKMQDQIEEAKKEAAAAYREQLKDIKEEVQGELEILDELEDRRRDLGVEEFIGSPETEQQAAEH